MQMNIWSNLSKIMDKLKKSKSSNEMFNAFLEGLRLFGYDYAMYAMVSKNNSKKIPSFFFSNYPPKWLETYAEKYVNVDPVRIYGLKDFKPFYWKNIHKKCSYLKNKKKC